MQRLFFLLLLPVLLAATASATEHYSYKVLDRKPQSRDTLVQGLQILDDKLYVSSGGWGKSRLLRYDFTDGTLEVERQVDPEFWAEGLTVLGDRLYLLTYKSGNLFVYDRDTLEIVDQMRIHGQGWGMTTDGEQLIYSDGSNRLYFIAPAEQRITRTLSVVSEDGRAISRLNELEWIDGRIWANLWMTNRIVIINPLSGEVEGKIDLQGLLPLLEQRSDTKPLNGIARNPADGSTWVTGKNWPWLYQIELVPQTTPAAVPEPKPR